MTATVTRFPAASVLRGRPLGDGAHLVVHTNDPSETALQLADIVVHDEPGETAEWLAHTLASLPGTAVVTRPISDAAWLAGTRDGHQIRFDHAGTFGPARASIALTWTTSGQRLCDFPERFDLIIGATRHHITATTTRCDC
ncbi:hypothetical protein BBK82_07050 [Lentzea guizhouensis]|uniref:Uncharacterized protein n=1 Tax=Lentzea guizhouensis TaxID=1586287 RepID=A0A1B2HDS0_9PSEU|nr:hypothetical protein [Lentzea guizhouensis]ANZ35877.1 hypothetical protein BBK82_07050 [Lentzea guizhouensis]